MPEVPDQQPVWSPNGNSLAFVGEWMNRSSVFVIGATGKSRRRITGARDFVDSFHPPAWSRDGRTIFYAAVVGTR